MSKLPIHFFTIVLNGKPFIDYHIEVFKRLEVPWHWHIIEGVASLTHDTDWSVKHGGKIPTALHQNGLSVDGTSQSLDLLKILYPDNISVYRKPSGTFWDGKREMIAAPIPYIKESAILWQLDSDELWTPDQIHTMHDMFITDPSKTSAWFWCWYYVGEDKIISSRNCYAQNPNQEWNRVWRFEPGMFWATHEPPVLAVQGQDGNYYNVGRLNPFWHSETEARGLVFDHYSYVTKEQLEFKESYYGYTGAVDAWRRLQNTTGNVKLREYFPWVSDETEIGSVEQFGVSPLARCKKSTGEWEFDMARFDGESFANSLSKTPGDGPIVIDGVFFQLARSGIARLWQSILTRWAATDFAKRIVVLDRNGTAPKIPGIRYRMTPAYVIGNMEWDRKMLDRICQEEGAVLFASTYYTRPNNFPTFQLVYDMIPEAMKFDLSTPDWVEKGYAFEHADYFAAISEHTKSDLTKFYPRVSPSEVPVVYPAFDAATFSPSSVEEILAFHEKYEILLPYFLLVGATVGYKNAQCFFDAIGRLGTQHGFEVILVGGHVSEHEINSLRLGCRVRKLQINDDELRAAYSGAISLVYPSLYEGFGLPILEAMSCGCPVITSPYSSIPEVSGDAALIVRDATELAEALCEVQKPSVRQRLISAGSDQLKKFSWDKAAVELQEILLRAVQDCSKEERWKSKTHQDTSIQQMPQLGRF